MLTISFTPATFGATLAKGFKAQGRPDGKGGYLVTLDRHIIDRLPAMRSKGE